jgi:hypothetical protein
MDSSSNSWFALEKGDGLIEEDETGRMTRSTRTKKSLFIALITFATVLGVISISKPSTPLLNAFSITKYGGEKTSYIPRHPMLGDQYLLGVGKADITGFVHLCQVFHL